MVLDCDQIFVVNIIIFLLNCYNTHTEIKGKGAEYYVRASVNAFAKEGCIWIELLGKTGKKRNFNAIYTTFN